MYKVTIVVLEGLKKQLEANNKILSARKSMPEIAKVIKANNKQIDLITERYYIS